MTGGDTPFVLFGRQGWGSAIVEAQLAWYRLPFRIEPVDDLFASALARERLGRINPAAQVPTLILPDGEVMTESAAITLYLAEQPGGMALAPPPGAAARARFLRWLVFVVANIYPVFTYADDPARFVPAHAAPAFRENADRYAERLWGMAERQAESPWFLGETFSALDIFAAVMTHWRPRRAWFAAHAPRLHAIATRTEARPELAAVFRRHFLADD